MFEFVGIADDAVLIILDGQAAEIVNRDADGALTVSVASACNRLSLLVLGHPVAYHLVGDA